MSKETTAMTAEEYLDNNTTTIGKVTYLPMHKAREYARLYLSEHLAQAELPSEIPRYDIISSGDSENAFDVEQTHSGEYCEYDDVALFFEGLQKQIARLKQDKKEQTERYFNIHVDHDRMKDITIPELTAEIEQLKREKEQEAVNEDFAVWLVARYFHHPIHCLWYKKNDHEQLITDGKTFEQVRQTYQQQGGSNG